MRVPSMRPRVCTQLDAMHVLLITHTADDVPDHNRWLTPWELEFESTLRVPKRRADWRLGRWTAKRAVQQWLTTPDLTDVEIRARPDGSPEALVAGTPAPCTISLSHSNARAVCTVAAAGIAIGCDIELVEPRDPSFAADYFTPIEVAFLSALPEELRALATTLLWSARESALKAIGEGLRLDTRDVAVVVDDLRLDVAASGWQPITVTRREPAASYGGWWRVDGAFVFTVVGCPRLHAAPREA
ncbi:MAG TPA: 4'-phosphopantetheinyl transferase superfamily protein [Blastocatellia bacterium]|nr:4'-phosphopantetheinyl transferase superfamily protein [Blastocatellia bacterium]